MSESFTITTGVPQGLILGPLLFVILISNLYTELYECEILLYADYTVLYCSDKDPLAIQSKLNLNLDKMATWFHENNLILNLKEGKTECMLFGNKSSESISLNIHGRGVADFGVGTCLE